MSIMLLRLCVRSRVVDLNRSSCGWAAALSQTWLGDLDFVLYLSNESSVHFVAFYCNFIFIIRSSEKQSYGKNTRKCCWKGQVCLKVTKLTGTLTSVWFHLFLLLTHITYPSLGSCSTVATWDMDAQFSLKN